MTDFFISASTVPLRVSLFLLSVQLPCTESHRYMMLLSKARLGKQPKPQTRPSIKTARKNNCLPSPQHPSGRRRNASFARTRHERQQGRRRFGTKCFVVPSTILRTLTFPTIHQGSKDPCRQV